MRTNFKNILRDAFTFSLCIPFFLISVVLFTVQVQAASRNDVLNEANNLKLAEDPIWLKLLHYDSRQKKSTIITDSFFISPTGRTCPKDEIEATINAFFDFEDRGNDTPHAQCRFPARYYWLSHKLPSLNYDLKHVQCDRLNKWGLFNSAQSVSVFLVSGYFGNPASTFGHALIKLNTEYSDTTSLFDAVLNYGAMIPENENTFFYIMRGLFGGYKAGFSDKYYYTEDLVYSRTEFRDIWEYKLNLTEWERTLLILHIWEIVGSKFDYYFLDKNCAYKLAELIDLSIEEDLLPDSKPFWYIPVELFHRLDDIENNRKKSAKKNLIESVRFIPSSQRKLYHQLRLLKPDELEVFNAIVKDGIDSLPMHLNMLETNKQILVLDSLLAYEQYKLIAKNPTTDLERAILKDRILLTRLHLPAQPPKALNIPELPSPEAGSRPMELGSGVAIDDRGKSFLRLTWSPFKKENVGQNSLEGDELVVFDCAAGFFEGKNSAFVDRFDLFRIININTLPVQVVDESLWSWKLRAGIDRIKIKDHNHYDCTLSFGAGKSLQYNNNLMAYGLIDFAGHTRAPSIRIRPHLGIRLDLKRFKAALFYGIESNDDTGNFNDVWGGKAQYKLKDQIAFNIEFSNETATRFWGGFAWYW